MKAISFTTAFFLHAPEFTSCSSDKTGVAERCSLYLAKSTIENAGLGVFTGVALEEGEYIGFGDPAIPVVDLDFHAGGSRRKEDYHWLIDEYVWKVPGNLGYEMETEAEKTSAFVTGLGSMPNCHFRLKNVAETEMVYDAAGVGREDFGAGAFTSYHNRSTFTLNAVSAGAELFVDYGINWFLSREVYMGLIPLSGSYPKANKFMESARELFKRISASSEENSGNEVSESSLKRAMSDMWKVINEHSYKSRPLSAIPNSFPTAERAFEVGIQQTELEQSIRSLEYLASRGKCLDNIQPGNSSVPHAGRGAIATKDIRKGGYISIAPLIHIPDRDVLTMYADMYDPETGEEVRDLSNPIGHQLLLNYCFGHGMSSLLLCPYAPGISFVNHNSKSPNAKIVWSADPIYQNENWLNEPISFFDNVWAVGLAFEYIATKDINEGDEIFINYGSEWEEAWKDHVQQWQPLNELHVSPHQLNENPLIPVPTHDEDDKLIGKSIEAWCHFSRQSKEEGEHLWQAHDMMGEEHAVERIIDRTQPASDEPYVYTVELHPEGYLVKNVPRKALSFYGKHYQSDMFIKGAFRHEMMIPDEMFPLAWKNIVQ